jgi:hypothetical protein
VIRFGLRLTLRSGREAAVRLVLTAAAVALGAGLLLRLAGATPRQVSVISAAESTAATIVGVAAGFAVFFLFRPAVAAIPFTGTPFFTGDLSLSVADIMIVAVGIPAAAAVAARLALRRVNISPPWRQPARHAGCPPRLPGDPAARGPRRARLLCRHRPPWGYFRPDTGLPAGIFLAAQLFLTSQLHYSLRPPGVEYYLVVLAGLAASLGIIASTLPLLSRITGPETARNE